MRGITDTVFRQMIAKCGKPDVFFSEFVNVESLLSNGQKELMKYLKISAVEHPVVAQIWGDKPENFLKASQLLTDLGFDGIDINMGCSVKKILKKNCCSALIKNETLSKEIIQAAKEGTGDLPLSIKTRIGFDEIATESWISFLLEQKPAVLTVHGRTAKQAYSGDVNWDEIYKVVKLRDNQPAGRTLIIGNGDVLSLDEIHEKHKKYKVDGVMIGRGILNNPYFFNLEKNIADCTRIEKINLLKQHIQLFTRTYGQSRRVDILKKIMKMYISDFNGAQELRSKLMGAATTDQVFEILDNCST